MTALKWLWQLLVKHGTKIIGFVTGTIAALASVDGIIPPEHLKFYMATIAVLTVWRGFFNSSQNSTPPAE